MEGYWKSKYSGPHVKKERQKKTVIPVIDRSDLIQEYQVQEDQKSRSEVSVPARYFKNNLGTEAQKIKERFIAKAEQAFDQATDQFLRNPEFYGDHRQVKQEELKIVQSMSAEDLVMRKML